MFSVMGTHRSAFFKKKNRAGTLFFSYHAISKASSQSV